MTSKRRQSEQNEGKLQTMTDAEYLVWFNREFWRTLHGPGASSLSRLQRDALCVMNFQAELNNGGMHQYLLNSSGGFAKETPDVFGELARRRGLAFLKKQTPSSAPVVRRRIERCEWQHYWPSRRMPRIASTRCRTSFSLPRTGA